MATNHVKRSACCHVATVFFGLLSTLSSGNIFHMATKIEWSPLDYAAKDVISALVEDSGFSYREIENQLQGAITYSRVRDICVARRTPVRLSEFIMLSRVCHSTPQDALREVLHRYQEMTQTEIDSEYELMDEEAKNAVDSVLKDLSANHSAEEFSIAANMDENRDVESETPDD